jgi:hypothetical protein
MKILKRAFIVIIVFIFLNILLTMINVLQNGSREWDGRSMNEILGVPAEEVTINDIEKLSKSDVMQLFYAAAAPEFARMNGEYKAKLICVGVLAVANDFYAHHLMGPGHWEGKAFFPFEKEKGWGYNLFTEKENGKSIIARTMKMDTFVGKSRFDDKESFHLVYKAYNEGRNHSMRDEIRKINDGLLLGFGCITWNLDTLNPTPFILYGEPSKWVGPDAAYPEGVRQPENS